MNKLTTTLLATALVGVFSVTAFASTATANDGRRGPGARAAGPIHFICSDEAASRIETGLGRMADRLDLTDTQTASFDAFKASALSAQESFAQVCVDFKPAERGQANADTDLVDRLNNRQAMMSAQLSAMAEVLPDFEVFYDSLTDAQKQQMRPPRGGQHNHGPNGNNGQHTHGPKSPQNNQGNDPANG